MSTPPPLKASIKRSIVTPRARSGNRLKYELVINLKTAKTALFWRYTKTARRIAVTGVPGIAALLSAD
jgi:hypothetical protein